jgi:hypothetical protein
MAPLCIQRNGNTECVTCLTLGLRTVDLHAGASPIPGLHSATVAPHLRLLPLCREQTANCSCCCLSSSMGSEVWLRGRTVCCVEEGGVEEVEPPYSSGLGASVGHAQCRSSLLSRGKFPLSSCHNEGTSYVLSVC